MDSLDLPSELVQDLRSPVGNNPKQLDLSKFQATEEQREEILARKKRQQLEDLYLYVCYKYPQYTLEDLYSKVPQKQIPLLAETAQKDDARFLLTLNNIINGPNVKGKNKKAYKETISRLQSIVEGKNKNHKTIKI